MSTDSNEGGATKSAGQEALESGRLVVGNKAENGAFEIGADGKPKVIDGADAALDLTPKDDAEEPGKPEAAATEEETPKPDDTKDETPGDGPEDLGDWNPEDPATAEKFDARFLNEDSTLNERAIGEEFWADWAKLPDDKKGEADLRPATRAYLKDTFKVSDEFITATMQGQVALQQQRDAEFTKAYGGPEAVGAAIAWAKGGGYTEEQRARFNALQKEGGEAFKEAVELLMSRHAKASGGGSKRDGLPGRRPSSPQRNATKSATPGNGEGSGLFQTKAAYQEAWTEALREEKAARRNKANDREAWVKADQKVQDLRKRGAKSAKLWK